MAHKASAAMQPQEQLKRKCINQQSISGDGDATASCSLGSVSSGFQ